MKRTTRAVQPEDLRDLLEQPPRASLAYVSSGEIQLLPVAFRFVEHCFLVGLPAQSEPPSGRVKVLVDDGRWYFDLRGVWVRGFIQPRDAPPDAAGQCAWYELLPEKVAAWHYGKLRDA